MLHLFFFRVVDVVKILSTKKYIYDISYTKMNKKTRPFWGHVFLKKSFFSEQKKNTRSSEIPNLS